MNSSVPCIRFKFLLRLIVVALASGSTSAIAQRTELDAPLLDELVVSATRTSQSVRELSAAVTVIDRETIEKSGAVTADQLVQSVPGVYAARMDVSAPNRIAQTYMRGLSGSGRTLVLIDGVPMNVLYDGQVDWSQLSTRDIERIEVVRGAASSLYGSNAMGGVINIISRLPGEGVKGRVSFDSGTNQTQRVAASVSGRSGATGFFVSGSRLRSDGYDMWTEAQKSAAGAAKDQLIAIGTKKTNLVAKLTHEISSSDFMELSVSSLDDLSTDFYDIPDYLPQRRKQLLTSARYQHFGDNTDSSILIYHRDGKQYADSAAPPLYTSIASEGEFDDRTLGLNAQSSVRLGSGHTLTFGVDAMDGEIDVLYDHFASTPSRAMRITGEVQRMGLFLQDELRLNEDWGLNLAGRVDHWRTSGKQTDTLDGQPEGVYPEREGTEFSPKVGVLYRLQPGTSVRANVGKAFKLPELWEMYSSNRRGATTYWGNPDLSPERLNAYDIGIDHYYSRQGFVKATFYRNEAEDFVYSVRRDALNSDKMNIDRVVTRGVELEARYQVSPLLTISASHTRNRSFIVESQRDPALEGKQLVYVPRTQTAVNLSFSLPQQTSLLVSAMHVGKRYADDRNTTTYRKYTTWDLMLDRQFTPAIKGRLSVINVADHRYDGVGYRAPGRLVTLGIDAAF
nr:TonB-dependent receptor [Azoarcus sp. L1K30]